MLSAYRRLRSAFHRSQRLTSDMGFVVAARYIDELKRQCGAPGRLEPFGYKVRSQNEEDGVLAEIFRRVGAPNRTFVEFGCGDGVTNNTALLLMQDWRGLWLDGSAANIARAHANWAHEVGAGKLVCKTTFITCDNINELLSGMGGELDLLSIDIDGNDYHIWDAIDVVSPRVVCIEYNAKFPPPMSWVMPYEKQFVWDGSDQFGASISALAGLAAKKGYALVGCDLAGINAFFVRNDLVGSKFASSLTAEALYQPPRYYLSPFIHAGHPVRTIELGSGA